MHGSTKCDSTTEPNVRATHVVLFPIKGVLLAKAVLLHEASEDVLQGLPKHRTTENTKSMR